MTTDTDTPRAQRRKVTRAAETPAGASTLKRKPDVAYTDELAKRICERLCDGHSLRSICSEAGMPDERTVRRWAAEESHPFAPQYARARVIGYHRMADEVIEIADGLTAQKGKADAAQVQRDRLRFDARRWLLSKALPKIYGDKISAEVTGPDGAPIQMETLALAKALIGALPELGIVPSAEERALALPPAAPAAEPEPPEPPAPEADKREPANGAHVAYDAEFDAYRVTDHAGRLAGYRPSLDAARALARSLPGPPPEAARHAPEPPQDPGGTDIDIMRPDQRTNRRGERPVVRSRPR
ncbi:MAG TPA: hypothetical protein VNK52_14305 [Hyphomicrobiaceae bacterium]|nr:hypothetical protein [Hyphomicrobiaceae bacterium]